MKKTRLYMVLMTAILTVMLEGCAFGGADDSKKSSASSGKDVEIGSEDDKVAFRPVDCGIQAQETYEYPFLGMTAKLSDDMLAKMDSRDVYVSTQEDYTEDMEIKTAMLRFFATTQEQKEESVMSIDIISWEEGLEKLGVLGVYRKEEAALLDAMTGCDIHKKLGESEDGTYEYYLSTNSAGKQELISELEKTKVTIQTMRSFEADYTYNAFSEGKDDDVASVGTFKTEDVFGKTYTEQMFADYDLTLVNVFATWCSPCVEEIPELEKLRETFVKKGIRFQVVGVVLDTKTTSGLDEGALERAQALYKKSGVNFPFLIPDDGKMNNRLKGIESVPESFFVDKNGRIVSDPYIGARSLAQWKKIVEQELKELKEDK